jgi:lipoprotein
MCKEKEETGCYLKGTVILLLLLLSVAACVFFWSAITPVEQNIKWIHSEVKPSTEISQQDSVKFASYTRRLDSMENELGMIRDQYKTDINIGIDRLNSWVGFWLAILAVVLLMAGVWQYMQVKKHDDDWKNLSDDYDSKIDNIKKLKTEVEEERTALKDKLRIETTLFNLLRTMAALHDPLMLPRDDERKQRIIEYLAKAQELLIQYRSLKQKESDKNLCKEEDSLILCLIFTNFRLNICRCVALFTSPSVSIKAKCFLDYVENEENRLSTRENMPIDSLNRFIGELGVLLKTLKSGV